jgi:sugar phosphate isomerase/epimerase
VIELFPGQRLGGEFGNAKFDHHSPTAHRDAVKAKLKAEDILAVNYGVVGIPDNEAQARAVFDFAKDMGLYAVTTESAESINLIEKLVKEYDIRVGFHEHAVQPGNYKYRVWHPLYVMGLVSGRDPRIGACADTGHWQRSGLRPVECLKMLEGRIVSVHLKDLNEFGKHGALDVPYGTGKGDIPGVLAELKRQGVKGNVMVEYEDKWKTNVAEATQCIAFVKSWQP